MLKCSSERWVWAPHSLSAGTSTTPRLSVSFLISAMDLSLAVRQGAADSGFRVGVTTPCSASPSLQGNAAGTAVLVRLNQPGAPLRARRDFRVHGALPPKGLRIVTPPMA